MRSSAVYRILAVAVCTILVIQCLSGGLPAAAVGNENRSRFQPEITMTGVPARALDESGGIIDVTVDQYTYSFPNLPQTAAELSQIELDSPYTTMALLILAFRTWTPEDPGTCLGMLDYLTDTGARVSGSDTTILFSRYHPWVDSLAARMTQNDKYRYIGNAYLGGAAPENDYTPEEPLTVTLRQSVYDPYKAGTDDSPAIVQVLIHLEGADNDRYCLFFQDEDGNWKVWGTNWMNLLADVKTPEMDILLPPETGPLPDELTQAEPTVEIEAVPAKAVGLNESGDYTIFDTTVEQYTFTFTTVPTCYEEIIQYTLDSPYKTMALYFLALRTWQPDNETDCLEMLDYLTNPNVESGRTDAGGKGISKKFSEYSFWIDFLRDRMKQNDKYRFIGDAYLGGASPSNDYRPDLPITVTVRQSAYDPYKAAEGGSPELSQVLIHLDGADNDRYGLLYQDQRGDWRFFSDNWKGLLADVQTPSMDILLPPETVVSPNPRNPQTEPVETVYDIPAKAPAVDDRNNPIVIDTTVKQHTFTFTTIPTCYEDIVQYKLDSPYKTMALLILAFRTWTLENRTDCLEMLDYLTNTAVDSGQTDADGRKLSRKFSEYTFWIDFLRDRMTQNNKYRYIANAYLGGAMPSNDYTPSEPVTITLRESVYNPYKPEGGHETDPSIYQVLISLPGAENDRYCLFYQDQRGDWRVWGDNWKGLLTDVQTPTSDIPLPPEVIRTDSPENVQAEPTLTVTDVDAMAVDENDHPIPVTVQEYTYTFSTVPGCYEDIVQYKLDSPYKAMALLFLAFRAWDPDAPEDCLEMLDYLTNTAVPEPEVKDAGGKPLCYPFSRYYPWISALKDRMTQNEKYRYIGSAYLKGAKPTNGYTPDTPVTVTVRQSVYDPYKAAAANTPELKQVLVSIAGADSDRYCLFYQDQRGDWRVFGDNWKGLLTDVQEIRDEGSIYLAELDPADSTVRFRADDTDETVAALVASYDRDGRLLALTKAEASGNSGFVAGVDPRGAWYQVFLLDKDSNAPLCGSKKLSK